MVSTTMMASPFEMVGHRGYRTASNTQDLRPENTEAALLQAAKAGASVEFDVHAVSGRQVPGDTDRQSTDVLVIHHDDHFGRVFALNEAKKPIRLSTLEELRTAQVPKERMENEFEKLYGHKVQLPDPFFKQGIPQTKPTIIKLLSETPAHLYLEMKTLETPNKLQKTLDALFIRQRRHNYLEPRIVQLFQELANDPALRQKNINPYDRITIISFSPRSLRKVYKADPNIRTGLDWELPAIFSQKGNLAAFTLRFLKNTLGIVSVAPEYKKTTPQFVQAAHDLGLRVLPWVHHETIQEEENAFPELVRMGVDGLITNTLDR